MSRLLMSTLAALPLGFAACGGDDAGAPGSTAAATPPTFLAAAEAICESMGQDAAGFSGGSTPTDEELTRLLRRWRSAFDRLDALEPPSDREADVQRMLVAYRNMTRAFELMVDAEDESVLAAVAGAAVFGQRGSRAAREAGLDACALFPEIEQPAADGQPMYQATKELVPHGARILLGDEVECSAKRSCRFEYRIAGKLPARLSEARAKLRARGWTSIRSGRSPNGVSWVMANRNDYVATVELVGDVAPAHCTGEITWGCVDSVWVHKFEVPEILTGG
jgi:hypothetical protein